MRQIKIRFIILIGFGILPRKFSSGEGEVLKEILSKLTDGIRSTNVGGFFALLAAIEVARRIRFVCCGLPYAGRAVAIF